MARRASKYRARKGYEQLTLPIPRTREAAQTMPRHEDNEAAPAAPEAAAQRPKIAYDWPWSIQSYPGGYRLVAANGVEVSVFPACANIKDFPSGRTLEEACEAAQRILRLVEDERGRRAEKKAARTAPDQGHQQQRSQSRQEAPRREAEVKQPYRRPNSGKPPYAPRGGGKGYPSRGQGRGGYGNRQGGNGGYEGRH